MARIRILLVIANDDFLGVVSEWLATVPEVSVVGTVHSGREAIEQASRLRPDVVLVDLVLRDFGGLEVTEQLKASPGGPRVVLTALRESRTIRGEAAAAGADGFLAGADMTTKLMPLVRDLVGGRRARRNQEGFSRPLETPRDS